MASYRKSEQATDTLRELMVPSIGSLALASAIFSRAGAMPVSSAPIMMAKGSCIGVW